MGTEQKQTGTLKLKLLSILLTSCEKGQQDGASLSLGAPRQDVWHHASSAPTPCLLHTTLFCAEKNKTGCYMPSWKQKTEMPNSAVLA